MTEQSQNVLTVYTEASVFGEISLALHSDQIGGFVVCIRAGFVDELYEDDQLEEAYEEISPYSWEDPVDFPDTIEEFNEYLAFCTQHIVSEFQHRLNRLNR